MGQHDTPPGVPIGLTRGFILLAHGSSMSLYYWAMDLPSVAHELPMF